MLYFQETFRNFCLKELDNERRWRRREGDKSYELQAETWQTRFVSVFQLIWTAAGQYLLSVSDGSIIIPGRRRRLENGEKLGESCRPPPPWVREWTCVVQPPADSTGDYSSEMLMVEVGVNTISGPVVGACFFSSVSGDICWTLRPLKLRRRERKGDGKSIFLTFFFALLFRLKWMPTGRHARSSSLEELGLSRWGHTLKWSINSTDVLGNTSRGHRRELKGNGFGIVGLGMCLSTVNRID